MSKKHQIEFQPQPKVSRQSPQPLLWGANQEMFSERSKNIDYFLADSLFPGQKLLAGHVVMWQRNECLLLNPLPHRHSLGGPTCSLSRQNEVVLGLCGGEEMQGRNCVGQTVKHQGRDKEMTSRDPRPDCGFRMLSGSWETLPGRLESSPQWWVMRVWGVTRPFRLHTGTHIHTLAPGSPLTKQD